MPIRICGMRKIMVKRPLESRIISGVGPLFEEAGAELMAAVQPMSAEMKQRLFGEEKSEALLMLTNNSAELKEGYGICLEREDGGCDFQIAKPVERWRGHQRAALKRIAEAENGF